MTAAPFVALWASFMKLSPVTHHVGIVGSFFLSILIVRYIINVLQYHHDQSSSREAKGRLPPQFPSFIPYLGSILQLGLNHKRLTDQIS